VCGDVTAADEKESCEQQHKAGEIEGCVEMWE
jgi:hypothetical protein